MHSSRRCCRSICTWYTSAPLGPAYSPARTYKTPLALSTQFIYHLLLFLLFISATVAHSRIDLCVCNPPPAQANSLSLHHPQYTFTIYNPFFLTCLSLLHIYFIKPFSLFCSLSLSTSTPFPLFLFRFVSILAIQSEVYGCNSFLVKIISVLCSTRSLFFSTIHPVEYNKVTHAKVFFRSLVEVIALLM